MECISKKQTAKNLAKEIYKEKYNTKHSLQRKEGQWDKKQKSEVIDSMLRSYPLDPIRCELKEDKIKYIFDGLQRATTIRDYFSDKYKLIDGLDPVVIDGKTYDISKKKYSDLDEEVREKLDDYEMFVYIFSDCTDKDIREMYRRQNNGKPLNNTQKRTAIESERVSSIVFELSDHPFFEKVLTVAQYKKDIQRDMIRETLMLINTNDEHDFTSFKAKDIDSFVLWYDQNISTSDIGTLTEVLDVLNAGYEELKVKPTSIPMILYAAFVCIKGNKDFRKFEGALNEFVNNYDSNEEYKQLVQSGTTASAGVKGRLSYWENIVESL